MSEPVLDFPKKCEFCGQMIGTRIDLDWHGLGNCAPVCDQCKGSGISPESSERNEDIVGRIIGPSELREIEVRVRLETLREVFTRWDKEGVESGDIWDWLCDELGEI